MFNGAEFEDISTAPLKNYFVVDPGLPLDSTLLHSKSTPSSKSHVSASDKLDAPFVLPFQIALVALNEIFIRFFGRWRGKFKVFDQTGACTAALN